MPDLRRRDNRIPGTVSPRQQDPHLLTLRPAGSHERLDEPLMGRMKELAWSAHEARACEATCVICNYNEEEKQVDERQSEDTR